VQRYVLFTTLVRYDSAMRVEPYLARSWHWSPDHRRLTFILHHDVRWHDGKPTTARDAAWTLNAARDSVTGYPRYQDVRGIRQVTAEDDTTLVLQFGAPQSRIPDVLTDLAVLPEHLLGAVSHGQLRRAPLQ
jgi:peptide/nickel transport system substrate-binding protein